MLAPRSLARNPAKQLMLTVFFALTALSCINVYNAEYFTLQHGPTLLALFLLAYLDLRWPFDRTGFLCALLILLLHVLGARYLYSFVPYDEWMNQWFGFTFAERFGWERNHYDRLVHFLYGVLLAIALVRWLPMYFLNRRRWSGLLAVDIVLSTSAVYELLEWLLAVSMAPDWAESFNGQQGDIFDAQKDMALAMLGAVIGIAISFPWWGWKVAPTVESVAQIPSNGRSSLTSRES